MTHVPDGWRLVTLNDLQADEPRAITDGPFGSNLTSAHYTDSGPRVVRLQNIGDGVFHDLPAHISEEHFQALQAHEVLPGDLLVASLGETLPRACLAPASLGPAIVKADCIRVRLSPMVDSRWVMYAMQRPEVRKWADERRHGVGRPRLGLKVIRQIPIPLPSLDEQRRIVEILEDHLSRLNAADSYLATASARGSTIATSALMVDEMVASSPKIALRSLLAAPLSNGRSVPTSDGGFPVLRLTALKGDRVDLSERKAGAWTVDEARPFLVQQGDFMVARGNGSLRLVGRGALVRDQPDPVAYPDTLIRLRVDQSRLLSDFLSAVWNSPFVRRQIESMARTTAGIYKVNQKHLESIVLPVPDRDRQAQVCARLDQIKLAQEQLNQALAVSAMRSASLRRALLDAAFSGRIAGRRSDMDRVEEMAGV